MKRLLKNVLPAVDRALVPAVYLASRLLRAVRTHWAHFPASRSALRAAGVLPVVDHYYEPLFNPAHLRAPLDAERALPGIRWNEDVQMAFLEQLDFGHELLALPLDVPADPSLYYLANGQFLSGDAEYWYAVIRRMKPRRIVEIGSGQSTLLARQAIRKNREEDSTYSCAHTCIEPYEAPWLERTGAAVVRQRVEEVPIDLFRQLERDDVLFIDSSHVIRAQGDVLAEYLEILPVLRSGVIVHVHDIFSPRDYPRQWVVDDVRLWNEQYLLEAFLTHNSEWEIVGALNCLHHRHYGRLKSVSPHLTPDREPGSFYIRRL
jgi:predicted O-methyltransferase YrrM